MARKNTPKKTQSKESMKKVFSSLSAINTLLERYPTLTTTDSMFTNFSVNTSVGFLFSVLEVCGVSQADIVNWICKIVKDGDDGVLDAIEWAIKGVLLLNIKNVLSCSFNPILPDNIMKYAIDSGNRQDPCAAFPYDPEKKNCIEINIGAIDLFGILANCPSNKKGGVFYFDAFDPSKKTIVTTESGDEIEIEEPNYAPNDLYKSRDFNAFLWYVINKGNIGSPTDKQKNTWDNRNKIYKTYEDNQTVKDNFFEPIVGPRADTYKNSPKIPIFEDDKKVLDKEQYIICQYAERGRTQAYSNILKVWINADRYYRTRKLRSSVGKSMVNYFNETATSDFITRYAQVGTHKYDDVKYYRWKIDTGSEEYFYYTDTLDIVPNVTKLYVFVNKDGDGYRGGYGATEKVFAINKTIFEFNYDYIYSLKLFDKKTLLANIVNSILGLSSSLSASFSFEQKQLQKKVEAMVEKIMEQDDTEVADDCYFKFDNSIYQQMIDEVTQSYQGSYTDPLSPTTENFDSVYDAIGALGDESKKVGQSKLIENVIQSTANLAQTQSSGISGGIEYATGFTLGYDFLMNFTKQMAVQIVLQVLSPKVAILYAINAQLLGDVGNIKEWEEFIKSFDNIMMNIIKTVKDIIIKELYNFVMQQLKPILQLLISKLALETIKYYKDLIQNLIQNCIPNFAIWSPAAARNTAIDNVNYADIIVENNDGETEQTKPDLPC